MAWHQIVGAHLTRAITAEQINARMRAAPAEFRHVGEIREIDAESRTVWLAFSSETPVQRWFGDEVLVHDAGAIRLDRLESGAALLVNHDWGDQIGVVESVEIGSDRRGRAKVRFGRSARADEILRDVVDGIRRHVSFGYRIHRIEVETRKGKPDLVRVTDWEPYEISLVSVPADPTVGVGRSQENAPEEPPSDAGQSAETRAAPEPKPADRGQQPMNKKLVRNASGALVWAEVDENGAIIRELEVVEAAGAERAGGETAERARVQSILDLGRQYEAADLAATAIRDGRSVDQFRAALLEQMGNARGGRALTEGAAAGSQIGMTDADARQYSMLRLFRALANPQDQSLQRAAAFEFECAQAAAQRAQRTPKGVLIPADVLVRALNTGTGAAAAGDTGGFLIATDLMSQSFVELLRNRTTIMQLATPMGGLVGNIDIPTQAGGATGYWMGEDDEATLSNLEFDQFSMTPKTVAGMTEITRRMLMQSSLDVEALARRDLATALAQAIDVAGYYGTGTANQPLGLTRVSGINTVDFNLTDMGVGTDKLPTYKAAVLMETEIAADNADVNSMAYVVNARMRGHLKTTAKFSSGTDQGVIWEGGGTVNGYRTEVTNQVINGDMIFGNFADFIIGMWGGLDVTVDPFTHSARGRIRIVMMQDVDMAVRRAQSFCLGRKIT